MRMIPVKQIIIPLLAKMQVEKNAPLSIVETGTIRNDKPQYEDGDGHSTMHICKLIKESGVKHRFYSMDLETAVSERYLTSLGLRDYVNIIKGNSLDVLPTIPEDKLDFVYLDSENDADLILAEFLLVEPKLHDSSIVCIDDTDFSNSELEKGKKVIPYVKSKGLNVRQKDRVAIISGFKHE